MRPIELARRSLARTDVQAALTIAGLLLVALALQGLVLYAYVAGEGLEEADRWMRHALRTVELRIERGASLETALTDLRDSLPGEALVGRMRDAQGALLFSWGDWPPESRQIAMAPRSVRSAALRWLRSQTRLVGGQTLPDGRRLELALSLGHFHSESAEVGRRIAIAALVSTLVALAIGLGASLRAFAPLRRATALLRGIDAGSLGHRLPTRGTGDPVDLHAETLNRVLARIDTSFARLRAFSSDAAHELRTPLNRMANVAEVALQGEDAREQRAALETIRATVDEQSQMVQSLLLLAELGDRRLALPWPALDVDAWIARCVELYLPSFEEQGVKLAARSDAGVIEGDRTLLDRILVNLLDNALAHLEPGARVEVEALRSGAGVTICVDDSGPGIPDADRERIFERFARRERGARSVGHGLGLAIARAVARLHGGELVVEESPLGGARFRVWLPGGPDAARALPDEDAELAG